MRHTMIAALSLAAFLAASPAAHAQERADVQVMAMATFVNEHCLGLSVNKPLFEDIFVRSGGFPGWKDNPFHRTLVRGEVATLAGDVPRSCHKLWRLYGETGAIQPGILIADPSFDRRPIIK